MTEYIDLTHTFKKEMPVWPGTNFPDVTQIANVDDNGYIAFEIETGMHVGTHIDAPLHMITDEKRISDFEVSKFFGNGVLIDARGKDKIDVDLLENVSIKSDDIVLVLTGFSKKFGQKEYYNDFPEITEAFAKKILDLGVKIIGLDSPSPDREPYLIHKLLFTKDVLIIENLTNLEKLLNIKNFEIIALPPKLHTEASPVRVVAKI